MADLKKRLIDMTKMRGKPYGMLVRKLDYPYSATGSELQSLAQASAQSGGSARPVSPPLLIYACIRTAARNWCAGCASAV